MAKYVMDTHMHSSASDGYWRPSEVALQAHARGLEVIALTDHDTINGQQEIIDAGKKLGLKVIPGIEIDAEYSSNGTKNGTKNGIKIEGIELLGLNIDLEGIRDFVAARNKFRLDRMNLYILQFNDYISRPDFADNNASSKFPLNAPTPISLENLLLWINQTKGFYTPEPVVFKWDIIDYVRDRFIENNTDYVNPDTFRTEYTFLLKSNGAITNSATKDFQKPTFQEAISAVKNAGGKAILAHPGLSKGYQGGMFKEWMLNEKEWFGEKANPNQRFTPYVFIKELIESTPPNAGLDGVELYFYSGNDKNHSQFEAHINKYFRMLARKLGLITTYGSDCHGPGKKDIKMGRFGSERIYEL